MSTNDRKNYLPPDVRASVIRETFESIAAVGFTKWKAEELALGNEVTEEDRPSYVKELERIMWPDFQKMAAKSTDDRLLDTLEYWTDKADKMGLKEWQEVLSKGEGGKPFYEAVAREVAEAEQDRSVLGYPLPEPSPSPAPQQDNQRSGGR